MYIRQDVFCLCSGYRFISNWRFILTFHHIIYIMWRLYYILFVYLKSFKELSFVLEAKAFAKVRDLFLTTKLFRKFFWKSFFQFENQTFFLAPLLLQGKILKRIFRSPYSASACQLNRSPSRKRMQRYRLFFHSRNSLNDFFSKKYHFWRNIL